MKSTLLNSVLPAIFSVVLIKTLSPALKSEIFISVCVGVKVASFGGFFGAALFLLIN